MYKPNTIQTDTGYYYIPNTQHKITAGSVTRSTGAFAIVYLVISKKNLSVPSDICISRPPPLPNLTLEILANRKRPSSTIVNDGLYGIVLFCSVVPQKHI